MVSKYPEIQAGDIIQVSYLTPNIPQRLIKFGEKGNVEHILCSLGGYEIIEADTDGVRWTDLRDYLLRRNCKLHIRRIPGLTTKEGHIMSAIWQAEVGEDYDYQGDVRLGIVMLLRMLRIHFLIRPLLRILPVGKGAFCSQLWAIGAHKVKPHLFINPANYSPEMIAKDQRLITVGIWNGTNWI